MSFAARALKDEARRYRTLARSINCPRTLALLDEMACDLENKAQTMEVATNLERTADDTRRKP